MIALQLYSDVPVGYLTKWSGQHEILDSHTDRVCAGHPARHSPALQSGDDALAALRKALTFHASFAGPRRGFGAGDRKIYTAAS